MAALEGGEGAASVAHRGDGRGGVAQGPFGVAAGEVAIGDGAREELRAGGGRVPGGAALEPLAEPAVVAQLQLIGGGAVSSTHLTLPTRALV